MPRARPSSPDPPPSRGRSLPRWDNDGGALGEGPQKRARSSLPSRGEALRLTNAELAQFRVRAIALENLLAVLLAEGPALQVEVAFAIAACVSPKPGLMDHALFVHATSRLIDGAELSPADGADLDG